LCKPKKRFSLNTIEKIFVFACIALIVGTYANYAIGMILSPTTVPVVSADTTVIPSDAIVMHTGDWITNGYAEYPILVLSGINHTYSQQVVFTVYFILGNDVVFTPIYPVLNQTFNAAGVKYRLWAVDWKLETVTVERVS
jgi:hypothetical protein